MATVMSTDPKHLRYVLGHYPTGVVAITGTDAASAPVGMVVGTFASVSLSPALVTFFADRGSTTWPVIRETGRFCANVLSRSQHHVCRALSRRGGDKFTDLEWHPSEHTGSPVVDGAAAWIDCRITAVHAAGDHDIVIGEVLALDLARAARQADPLIFFRGGYSRLTTMEDLS